MGKKGGRGEEKGGGALWLFGGWGGRPWEGGGEEGEGRRKGEGPPMSEVR